MLLETRQGYGDVLLSCILERVVQIYGVTVSVGILFNQISHQFHNDNSINDTIRPLTHADTSH